MPPPSAGPKDAEKRLAAKATERTLDAARALAEDLDRLPGVTAVYETYAGETHMSVLPVAVNRALHWVFGLCS